MTTLADERKRPSEPSELAERKTNRLKRKDLRSACVNKSQVFVSYSVPIEYAVILARTIMIKWTCAERFTGVPIAYGQMAHTIMLDLSHFYKFFPKNGKIRSNAAVT